MFLATGGAAASNATGFWVQCSAWFPAAAVSVCNETSAAAAFGFLGWVAGQYCVVQPCNRSCSRTDRPLCTVWAYTGTVLVMLIIQAQRGNYIWQRSVKEINVQGGNNVPPVDMTAPGLYGTDAKPHEQAALHPGQVPYAYPPSTLVSPQPTGQPPIPQV